MLRFRMVGTLVVAVALLAAACGEEAPEVSTGVQEEVSAPDASSDDAEPSSGQSAALDEEDASEDPSSGDEDSAAAGSDGPDDAVSSEDAAPVDAQALLAAATTGLDGRSVRGEATIELAPGFKLSTNFESDADGDLAAIIEIPPGLDPEFPGGADTEVRYVGGVTYVRPPLPAETLAELGVDEAWYAAEPAAGGDPMNDAMGSAGGVMCVFPQMSDAPSSDCDLLGETGTFLEAASEAGIVGREDVRGVEATRVRFLVSLLDLVGEALGMEPDEDDGEESEGGAFDDNASDPFAEGLEQIFGFLDAEFEVEVWIDDENLIRRLAFDLASLFAGLAGADVEMPSSLITVEFYDFDADISVEAPPPEVIIDDPDLLVGGDDFASSEEYEPEYDDDEDDDDENDDENDDDDSDDEYN